MRDVRLIARLWAEALGYSVDLGDDGNAELRPPAGSPPSVPTSSLQAAGEPKNGKNRFHPDLTVPATTDRAPDDPAARTAVRAEIDRLLELGATHADAGQTGDEGFVVLADPEGNEFCVLRSTPS